MYCVFVTTEFNSLVALNKTDPESGFAAPDAVVQQPLGSSWKNLWLSW